MESETSAARPWRALRRGAPLSLAVVVATLTFGIVAQATQSITTPNAMSVSYNLAPGANSAAITPVASQPAFIMGVKTQTPMSVLRNALKDPDPAFNALAVEEPAGRSDPCATDLLREALQSPDPSRRLPVLLELAHVEGSLPLIEEALADPDETVTAAAAAVLEQARPAGDAT